MRRSRHVLIVTAMVILCGSALADSTSGLRRDTPPEGMSAQGWRGILAQLDQPRYDAEPAPGEDAGEAWLLTNPALGIEARFAAGGLYLSPRASEASWSWGMRVTGFGPSGAPRPVAEPELFAEGNRVEYRRPGLTEWYVNDEKGLEQGFTIDRAPSGDPDRLEIVLELSGSLVPVIDGSAALLLQDAAGATVLRYAGLRADDAAGRSLGARLAVDGTLARIEVDIAGAAFPIVVDPLITTQAAKLTAADAAAGESFGYSVSISGDTAVVGAFLKNAQAGAAYVFERNRGGGNSWDQVRKLTASDAAAGDRFGTSVSISVDTILVGADKNDDPGVDSGAAYVFERNAGGANNWGQVHKLIPPDLAAGDLFGSSVSISGDTAVGGSPANDDAGSGSGSAYVFARNGVTGVGPDVWGYAAKLTASDAAAGDLFGSSVSISGDTAVVGGAYDDSVQITGAAYVFERNAGGADSWDEVRKLTAANIVQGDNFGISVSISGDTVVVGAHTDDLAGTNSGSAYVFERNVGGADSWGQVATLTAADATPFTFFGYSVAISGDTIIVGMWHDQDLADDGNAAYVFERNAGGANQWDQVAKLTASDAAYNDGFGFAVSISGDTAVVGAPANDDAGSSSGSAYTFSTLGCSWAQIAKRTASDASAIDIFGESVSISGDTVVVGAFADDDAGSSSGSAYVFGRNVGGADAWGQVAKLTAADGAANDNFGFSVSISGDTAVVGAFGDDDAGSSSGSAYVFARNAGGADAWGQVAKLTASNPGGAANDKFGTSVSISGDTVVVGGSSGFAYVFYRNDGGADAWGPRDWLVSLDFQSTDAFGTAVSISGDTLVVGAPANDDAGSSSGSAYVFVRNVGGGDVWGQVAKLTASDAAADDRFGRSVSISGDTVVVGADLDDDAGVDSGSAYVFERNVGGADNWGEVAKLTASDVAADDRFGTAVSIGVDTVVVGADRDDDVGSNSGSAYVFERNVGGAEGWGQVAKVVSADAATGDQFGHSVSISEDAFVVGANLNDDAGTNSGSVYVFKCLDPASDTDGDRVSNAADCAPFDSGLWRAPGEARNLLLAQNDLNGVTTLSWQAPLDPGGTAVRYDAVRSNVAADFATAWFCVYSDGLGTAANDSSGIPFAAIRFYLVRGENNCGLGSAGKTSAGVERQVHDCP